MLTSARRFQRLVVRVDSESVTVRLNITQQAAAGPRTTSLSNGAQTAALADGFTVLRLPPEYQINAIKSEFAQEFHTATRSELLSQFPRHHPCQPRTDAAPQSWAMKSLLLLDVGLLCRGIVDHGHRYSPSELKYFFAGMQQVPGILDPTLPVR